MTIEEALGIAEDWPEYAEPPSPIFVGRVLAAEVRRLRQRHAEAVTMAGEAISGCTCDQLHHKKSERHNADEACPVVVRLTAWLASEAKARLT